MYITSSENCVLWRVLDLRRIHRGVSGIFLKDSTLAAAHFIADFLCLEFLFSSLRSWTCARRFVMRRDIYFWNPLSFYFPSVVWCWVRWSQGEVLLLWWAGEAYVLFLIIRSELGGLASLPPVPFALNCCLSFWSSAYIGFKTSVIPDLARSPMTFSAGTLSSPPSISCSNICSTSSFVFSIRSILQSLRGPAV